ncbi:MAG: hypothetical protein ACOCWQ_01550 [Nanoarchaeota archaeon]
MGSQKDRMGKKGQTEMLGFAMVILLVSVGMLFVISFIVLRAPSDIKRVFTDKQLAVNMNDALLSATTSCNGMSFEDLITDCAENGDVVCPGGLDSCMFVQTELQHVFGQTLEVWGKSYRYQVYLQNTPEEPLVKLQQGTCNKELEPGIFYLPTDRGTIFVRLDICAE